jgi:hypothetical protein
MKEPAVGFMQHRYLEFLQKWMENLEESGNCMGKMDEYG